VDLKSVIDTRRTGEPDLPLFLVVLALTGTGIAMCYSASAVYAMKTFGSGYYFLQRQAVWALAGFAALFAIQRIDYRQYARHTKVLLLVSMALLLAVLIPGVGHAVKGSSRWINLGFAALQPSEFVKLVLVVYLVKVFSAEHEGAVTQAIQLLIPMIIVAFMFILIIVQPDFGTAINLLLVSVIILFVSGFPFNYILGLFLVSIPMFYLMIYQVSYRWDRILAYLNPWEDRYGIGYHIIQSFTAFKKGGFLGTGLGFGTQKLARLPEPHTDFIYAVIAEEAGLAGTLLVLGLFCAFFYRGMCIALDAPDEYGRVLAMGLTLLVVIQAFINIGVVSGSLPATGIPLPFISYGGSSLLSCMIASGMLLNISRYREVVQPELKFSDEVWQ
jgi:cell division protein FtsW